MPRKKRKPAKRSDAISDDIFSSAKKSRKSWKYKDPSEGIMCQVQFSESEYPYRLGNIIIKYNNDSEENLTTEFFIQFKPESICCLLLVENESEKKVLQAAYETPFNILECLASLNIFHFITNSNTLQPGENIIKVCLNPSVFISLKSASEPYFNHLRHQMYRILQYFLDIKFDEYDEDYLYDEEQVTKIYNCFTNSYDPDLKENFVTHQSLIPELRPYQCQAVSWMLKCEKENSLDTSAVGLHQLYTAITLVDGHIVYFHKYGGFFVKERFAPDNLCKGGILADEMGLGKTLEVLACILLNPRNTAEIQTSENCPLEKIKKSILVNKNQNSKQRVKKRKAPNYYKRDSESDEKDSESDEEFKSLEYDENFGCICGSEGIEHENKPSKLVVMCIKCNILQHAECVMYRSDISEEDYICPVCWIDSTDLLPSPATLIISPASILHQWEEEILKHVNKNCLKVFMYHGVEKQKFVHPSFLANHDIVLVSYETLRKELTYVDVPYGSAGHSLRYNKKFITIPSPMCCVQWWRVCLDEAQMVESVVSKVAKMAGKLVCVNRWCITGTPIKKSVEDLYGLFLFLNINPYQNKMWWREVIWKPFVNGDIGPLSSSLKSIAWRTMKHQVFDQVGVPDVIEVTHKLEFSAIERIYYLKQHSKCKTDFMEKIIKFDDLNVKLCSLDRQVLSKIVLPLKRLQLVCCHFQIITSNVEVQKLSKMTTTELLAHLLKTTKYECEDVHRKLIMAMNGLAGIFVIQKDFANAVETYEKVLHSIEDNKQNLRTDVTQHIHASYHLSKILSVLEKEGRNGNSKFTPDELNAKVDELSQSYIDKHKLTLDIFSKNIEEISDEISEIKSKFKVKGVQYPVSAWWAAIFENMTYNQSETFLEKLVEMLESAPGNSYLRKEKMPFMIRNSSFSSLTSGEFLSKVFDLTKDLHDTRKRLKNKINEISVEPSASTLNTAISCHLRPTPSHKMCIYCETEDIFKTYETKLFRFDETKQATDEEEKSICFESARRGTHADSDLELVLKFLLNYSRRIFKGSSKKTETFKIIADCNEDGANELKLLDALKKEFKVLRNVWKKCFDYASQKDEVEMAKISSRLILPGELPQTPPVPYILYPHQLQPKQVQYHSDIVSYQFELKKKLGQLFYLQNLEKAENKNAPFEENCPICQQVFESSWSVLQCGHCLCLLCIEQLLSSKKNFTNSLGFIFQGIRCPLCREFTAASDVYFIENNKEEDVAVKGFYSTKTNAVVKCLLEINNKDPEAKSIVFSSFLSFLYILEKALEENGIKFFNFCRRKRFQEQLEQFKKSKEINTLLVPLNFGCSGLNITEATNVLLLEPILDNSKHLQAIGRVHRIGQTKAATIHRFVISKTIEENVFDIMKKSTSYDTCETDITLQSLKDIFKET